MKGARRGRPKGSKVGDVVTQPKPFTIFEGKGGKVGVRIGTQRPFWSVGEVVVSAAPIRVTRDENGLRIAGEGVARRHKGTIAVTS